MVLRARVPSRRDRRVGHGRVRGASVRRVPHGDGVRRLDAVPGRASGGRGDIGIVGPLPRAGGRAGRTRLRAADRRSSARSSGCSWRPAARSSPEPFGSRAWCGRRSSIPACSARSRAEPEARSGSLPADARVSRVARRRLADAAGRARAGRRGRAAARGRPAAGSGDVHAGRLGERSPIGACCSSAITRSCCRTSRSWWSRRRWAAARRSRDPAGPCRSSARARCRRSTTRRLVAAVARADVARTSAPDVPTRSMPPGYWAFLLVPAIATVGARTVGGTHVARPVGRT